MEGRKGREESEGGSGGTEMGERLMGGRERGRQEEVRRCKREGRGMTYRKQKKKIRKIKSETGNSK